MSAVVRAARKVSEDAAIELWVVFDAGDWTLESRVKKRGRTVDRSIVLSPKAMDAFVAAWPRIKAEAR